MGCFHLLATMHNAAMSIGTKDLFESLFSVLLELLDHLGILGFPSPYFQVTIVLFVELWLLAGTFIYNNSLELLATFPCTYIYGMYGN